MFMLLELVYQILPSTLAMRNTQHNLTEKDISIEYSINNPKSKFNRMLCLPQFPVFHTTDGQFYLLVAFGLTKTSDSHDQQTHVTKSVTSLQ